MIEVVIERKTKTPAGDAGVGLDKFQTLEQIEFFGAVDGCPAVVDPQFIENAFGVGAQGVE